MIQIYYFWIFNLMLLKYLFLTYCSSIYLSFVSVKTQNILITNYEMWKFEEILKRSKLISHVWLYLIMWNLKTISIRKWSISPYNIANIWTSLKIELYWKTVFINNKQHKKPHFLIFLHKIKSIALNSCIKTESIGLK